MIHPMASDDVSGDEHRREPRIETEENRKYQAGSGKPSGETELRDEDYLRTIEKEIEEERAGGNEGATEDEIVARHETFARS